MRMSFAWILDVDNKKRSPWLKEENEDLGHIFDRLEVMIGCGTLNEHIVDMKVTDYQQTHDYDVKFKAIQLAFPAFEFCADGTHFVRGDSLICDTLVVVVHQCLGDIDTDYCFCVGG